MKLYIYDHCPYCTKARMIFGYKNIPVELITLLNDDEETPHRLIGKKMVPILEKDDATALPESLDIIDYVNQLSGSPILKDLQEPSWLQGWLLEARQYHYKLAMPRWVQADLEEFKTLSAKEYFIKKKELAIGPFTENLEKTPELVKMAHEHLNKLNNMITDLDPNEMSLHHIHLFATLRCLTVTHKIEFPEKVDAFMKTQARISGVPLHDPISI